MMGLTHSSLRLDRPAHLVHNDRNKCQEQDRAGAETEDQPKEGQQHDGKGVLIVMSLLYAYGYRQHRQNGSKEDGVEVECVIIFVTLVEEAPQKAYYQRNST